jgi:hypothetical protein
LAQSFIAEYFRHSRPAGLATATLPNSRAPGVGRKS